MRDINLTIGTRIYYSGDMANCGGFGTVIALRELTQYSPQSVDILLDEIRFEGDTSRTIKALPLAAFGDKEHDRFQLASVYDARREARMAELKARFAGEVTP